MRKRYEYVYMYKAFREDGTSEYGEVRVPFKINRLQDYQDVSENLSVSNGYTLAVYDLQFMRKRRVA